MNMPILISEVHWVMINQSIPNNYVHFERMLWSVTALWEAFSQYINVFLQLLTAFNLFFKLFFMFRNLSSEFYSRLGQKRGWFTVLLWCFLYVSDYSARHEQFQRKHGKVKTSLTCNLNAVPAFSRGPLDKQAQIHSYWHPPVGAFQQIRCRILFWCVTLTEFMKQDSFDMNLSHDIIQPQKPGLAGPVLNLGSTLLVNEKWKRKVHLHSISW